MMPVLNTVVWAVSLFALWVLLSGKLDAFHLAMGAVSAGVVAVATRPLLALPPAIGPGAAIPFSAGALGRFLLYLPWLLWQILAGAFQVASVVLHPRLPIEPHTLRIRTDLPHPLARLTLANSITLTPGTLTLEVDGDEFLVHALTRASAGDLHDDGGEMHRRVRRVFADRAGGAA